MEDYSTGDEVEVCVEGMGIVKLDSDGHDGRYLRGVCLKAKSVIELSVLWLAVVNGMDIRERRLNVCGAQDRAIAAVIVVATNLPPSISLYPLLPNIISSPQTSSPLILLALTSTALSETRSNEIPTQPRY